jgi:hypothetical protein
MATFPNNVFNSTSAEQTDGTSTVNAADVNIIYQELEAIETALGTNPSGEAASVKARIVAAEEATAVISANYVSKAGGSTIIPSGTSTVNLSVQAQTSQTANLLEFKDSSATARTVIRSDGYIQTIDGGTA